MLRSFPLYPQLTAGFLPCRQQTRCLYTPRSTTEHFLRKVGNPRWVKAVYSGGWSDWGTPWIPEAVNISQEENPSLTEAVNVWRPGGKQEVNSSYSMSCCLRSCEQPAGREGLFLGVSHSLHSTSFSLPFSAECLGGRGDRHRCYWLQTTPLFNTPSPNRMQPSRGHRPAHPLPLTLAWDSAFRVCLERACLESCGRGNKVGGMKCVNVDVGGDRGEDHLKCHRDNEEIR